MAQDIIIRGVTYPGVEKLNLATQGGTVLFHDTTPADATASDIAVGKTAFIGSGLVVGTKQPPTGSIPITENGLYDVTDYASALVNVSGGGGDEPFAVIAVTYPVGSACVCTKGTTTLPAAGTGGSYLFLIPESGTWTVSCTDGTRTKSTNVVINHQYQAETVRLSYTLILFDGASGGDNTEVTGGWERVSTGTLTITETEIKYVSSPNKMYCAFAVNPIPVYDYSIIKFVGYTKMTTSLEFCNFMISSAKSNNSSDFIASVRIPSSTSGTYTEVSIDLSGLSLSSENTYYVGLSNGSGANATFLSKCVLE